MIRFICKMELRKGAVLVAALVALSGCGEIKRRYDVKLEDIRGMSSIKRELPKKLGPNEPFLTDPVITEYRIEREEYELTVEVPPTGGPARIRFHGRSNGSPVLMSAQWNGRCGQFVVYPYRLFKLADKLNGKRVQNLEFLWSPNIVCYDREDAETRQDAAMHPILLTIYNRHGKQIGYLELKFSFFSNGFAFVTAYF